MSRSKVLAKEKFMCKYIRTSLAKKNSFPENFAFCEIFWIEFSRNQICCSLHKKKKTFLLEPEEQSATSA